MESFIGWIGGKRMLRKAILERFPTDEVPSVTYTTRWQTECLSISWTGFARSWTAVFLTCWNTYRTSSAGLVKT